MASIADLRFLSVPVDDPVATARFIGGMILTDRQKAATLRDYLIESGQEINEAIREAAGSFIQFF